MTHITSTQRTDTPTNTRLPCIRCNGTGQVVIEWVDGDYHSRSRKRPCPTCHGMKEINIPISGKDRAAGEV